MIEIFEMDDVIERGLAHDATEPRMLFVVFAGKLPSHEFVRIAPTLLRIVAVILWNL